MKKGIRKEVINGGKIDAVKRDLILVPKRELNVIMWFHDSILSDLRWHYDNDKASYFKVARP